MIEAGERSGARNQARLALQHGRPEILLRELLAWEWAREIAARPGVSVVGAPDELFDVIEEILDQRAAELSSGEDVTDLAVV